MWILIFSFFAFPCSQKYVCLYEFTEARFICPMICKRCAANARNLLFSVWKNHEKWSPSVTFTLKFLGCSHKRDRWAAKMGLATACPSERKREREMFINHSAAKHTPSRTVAVQLCSVYHVWREKVSKWHKDFGREREQERERECLQC